MRSVVVGSKSLAVAICGSLLLGACASAARPELMATTAATVAPAAPADAGYKAVRVSDVTGGGETNPMWMSNVSAQDFRAALETSLRASNYLADTAGGARYDVTAQLLNVDRPMVGFSMTSTSTVNYTVRGADGRVVLQEIIKAPGTAKMGDAFLGVERVRLANENAIRENIRQFIDKLRASLTAQAR
jgi:hypothetical protein